MSEVKAFGDFTPPTAAEQQTFEEQLSKEQVEAIDRNMPELEVLTDPGPPVGDEPSLPTITEYIPHTKEHGGILYDGRGHYCRTLNCEVNRNPHDMNVIFAIVDRKEWL